MQTKYDFENWKKQGSYVIPYEIMGDQIQNIWSSGNSGFALTGGGGSYDKFPTAYTEESALGSVGGQARYARYRNVRRQSEDAHRGG